MELIWLWRVSFKPTAHLVVISRGNSNGAYIQITDMYNKVCQRLANTGTITIGGITYTGRGTSNNKPSFSISENGTIYAPVLSTQPTQPTEATYNSGTVLTIGTDDATEPNLYLFYPN